MNANEGQNKVGSDKSEDPKIRCAKAGATSLRCNWQAATRIAIRQIFFAGTKLQLRSPLRTDDCFPLSAW